MTAPHEAVDVRTATGLVRGRMEDGLAVFRGIPFAEPPVGGLRFAAPQPARAWAGTREAVSFGPPPPQSPLSGPAPGTAGGDGWLTVNLWSPQPDPGAGLPVMVWIYGGAYRAGHAADPVYDGARLAREGGVALVTFNYRVGVEGFGQIDGARNRGLLDQVAALEWVRGNISGFGGDPGNVTVFGESAGAGSVAALLAMPRAAGLLHRAIAQSVPGTYLSAALARDIMAVIAGRAGRRPTLAELAGLAPAELVAASDALSDAMLPYAGRWGGVAYTPTPFSPVVDGDILPRTPWQALAGGAGREVALIAGHNQDEFRLFVAMAGKLGQVSDAEAAAALETFAPVPDAYRQAFPAATAERLFEVVQSDWLFRVPSHRLAEAQAAGGGRAYLYELTWPAPGMGGVLGACHALDVPLVFGNLAAGELATMLPGAEAPAAAAAVSGHFRSAWTAFARSGDPGWPPYDSAGRQTAVFGPAFTVAPYPEQDACRLWESHQFLPLPLLGGSG
jgi:para-nitrobenzyl esterase